MKIKKNNFRYFASLREKAPSVDSENPNVVTFSFASEEPYERYWGMEILSMKDGAMDISRLNNSAPLLFNHNRDKHIGVVQKAWIEDNKAYCQVKFSNSEFAQEKLKDLNDGILVNVSLGYEIRAMELLKEKKGEVPEYLVTDFLPFEISCVTIPADNSVGVGRAADSDGEEIELETSPEGEGEDDAESKDEGKKAKENETKNLEIQDSINNERKFKMENAKQAEKERIAQIRHLAREHGHQELAEKFINEDKTPAEFAMALVKELGGEVKSIKDKNLDFSKKEQERYSITRALNAMVTQNWQKAGFEMECHKELQRQLGRETKGFFMPANVGFRAPYLAGTATQGSELVQTEVKTSQFIDVLRNRAVVLMAGGMQLTGLQGNIALPRKNGRSSVYWVSENGTITESEATFDQVAFSPKTIGALSVYSHQLLAQTSLSVDALIMDDLNKEVALGIDAAAVTGTGANGQPTGLLNKAGVNSVAMGTNGAAITSLDTLIDMETKVAEYNADVNSMSYITNAKQIGILKKLKASGTGEYLWKSSEKPFKTGAMAPINGYDMFRSNQLPSNLVKGTSGAVCSAVVFGDFSQLVLAQWGAGIEVVVNPYGSQFAKGGVEVRAMALVDVNVRQEKAFTIITDAL